MRILKLIWAPIVILIILACEGPQGPPGFDGDTLLGTTLEFQTTFSQSNNFSSLYTFPTNITVYESDAVLVYLLEETLNNNGTLTKVWTPLPQSFFVNLGLLQYTFNHTYSDISVLLQSNFDLNNLSNVYTQNQIFRVVIMPAAFAEDPALNHLDLNQVMDYLNLKEQDVIPILEGN